MKRWLVGGPPGHGHVHDHLRGDPSSTREFSGSDTDALNELRDENQTCFKDSLDATGGLCECEWRLRAEAGSRGISAT